MENMFDTPATEMRTRASLGLVPSAIVIELDADGLEVYPEDADGRVIPLTDAEIDERFREEIDERYSRWIEGVEREAYEYARAPFDQLGNMRGFYLARERSADLRVEWQEAILALGAAS